ncbi:MAG: YdcF family protein [Candidatus Wolfebacteria bacterium]|nr:YdcF family protein [Candidatus Wolfebacteria bacterium]
MNQFFLLSNLVFSQKPEKSDAIFVHAREGRESLDKAITLHKESYAPLIIINGLEIYKDYAGSAAWKKILKEEKVLDSAIFMIRPSTNTKLESEAVVKEAKKRRWSSLIIVAQPYHLLRAWLTIINQMRRQDYWFKVVCQFDEGFDWDKIVLGSQAEVELPRRQIIEEEEKRILRYQSSRETALPEEAVSYHKKFFS